MLLAGRQHGPGVNDTLRPLDVEARFVIVISLFRFKSSVRMAWR